jgi:hypothetical protein
VIALHPLLAHDSPSTTYVRTCSFVGAAVVGCVVGRDVVGAVGVAVGDTEGDDDGLEVGLFVGSGPSQLQIDAVVPIQLAELVTVAVVSVAVM